MDICFSEGEEPVFFLQHTMEESKFCCCSRLLFNFALISQNYQTMAEIKPYFSTEYIV